MTTKYLDGAGLKYFHDTYVLTSAQITTMINNALSQYQQDIVTVVSALPTTGQKEGILYMVPDATDATKFDTFVWEITDDTTTPPTYGWVQQGEGNATVDLSNYYTKTETDTLLAGKASSTHTHGNITNDGKLGTASRAVVTDANGAVDVSSVTATELGYVSGVTSSIQTQLNAKQNSADLVALTNAEIDSLMVQLMAQKKYTDGSGVSEIWLNIKNYVYSQLLGKADASHTHTKSEITDFPSFATVATSGSYNDLSNKPTIPTVNNATLTIQKNGTTVKTFTANASSNVTANITVPTKTSDLTNNSGFLTDVTWNDVNNKPSFATVATSGSYNDLSDKPSPYTPPTFTYDSSTETLSVSNTTATVFNYDSNTETLEIQVNG